MVRLFTDGARLKGAGGGGSWPRLDRARRLPTRTAAWPLLSAFVGSVRLGRLARVHMVLNALKETRGGGAPLDRSPIPAEPSRQIFGDFSFESSSTAVFGASGPSLCRPSNKTSRPASTLGLRHSQWRSTRGLRGRLGVPRARLWLPRRATQADSPERSLAGGRSEASDKERGPPPPPRQSWPPTRRCRGLQRAQGPSASAPQCPATLGLLGPAGRSGGNREARCDRSATRPRVCTDFCGRDQLEAM